ncbi:MAG: signal peptidase II [Spirochaetes bacterium]|nr:signal peptidase II [Spirochaetota bacterium]MBL7005603.1 signal peptidase II [Spirochaetia bacterium]
MNKKERLLPFVLTLSIVIADQLIKFWISANIPQNTIGSHLFGGDFLRIIHVRNNAIAFSMGSGLPDFVRMILFIMVPLVLIGFLLFYVIRSNEFTPYQRWLIAGAAGGGLGNLTDRIFRSSWVIDYIDVKFYGLFGMERFPTFNLADSSIVVCGILLILTFIYSLRGKNE